MTRRLAGKRILVVEDEYFIADEMRRSFEAAGAQVIGPVPLLSEALDLIDRTPDLHGAVLDVNLRGEMAYPIADVLRRRGVPFVFATGYDATAIPPDYRAVVRCEKPVASAEVEQALFG